MRFNPSTELRRVGPKLAFILANRDRQLKPARHSGSTHPNTASTRELAFDASRGAAMLLVCLSHFADGYLFPSGAMGVGKIIKEICISATPTFVLLSGMMVGYLHAKNPEGFSAVRAKLVDRGLFLISVCHVLIVLCTGALFGGLRGSSKIFFVTDMLAVAIICMPPLVERWSARRRALIGGFVFCASSLLATVWHPHRGATSALVEILFGQSADDGTRFLLYTFPLVPWLAVYLTATAVGGHVAHMLREGRHLEAARQFATAGVAGFVLAGDMLLLRLLVDTDLPHALHQLTSPMVKTPPSPAFICFNAGIGLLGMAAALAASVRPRGAAVLRSLAYIGQASLFVFVIEYFVYDFALFVLHPRYTPMWPALFLLSLAIIWPLAALWAKRGYNRFLTVGYERGITAPAPKREKGPPVQALTR